jgi:hypothetical protein
MPKAWLEVGMTASAAKLTGPRVLALRREIRKSAAVAVRAMSVVQIVTRILIQPPRIAVLADAVGGKAHQYL